MGKIKENVCFKNMIFKTIIKLQYLFASKLCKLY